MRRDGGVMKALWALDFLTHRGARPSVAEEYDGRLVASKPDPCGCVQETWRKYGEDTHRVTSCKDHLLSNGLGRNWP